GYSGLRERRYDRPDEKIATLTVRIETLDGALPPERPVAFVKIDVEGAELAVLRGARRTLARWRPHVVFEHGRGAADRYDAAPQDVFDLLESCGLATSLLERRLAGRAPLSRSEFVRQFETGANWYFVAHPTS
ncbi:MAG TPA: FkbM family methyltransferase, partial [Planctomycetota bacterium]|nr:FkbM family methyltransferase [Planctomycetota bacterium]